jgi:DNA-binding MarR family transcriptional regulator
VTRGGGKGTTTGRRARGAERRSALAAEALAEAADAAAWSADPVPALYERPGFKLRRAHQIALSIFAEECRAFGVTTTQFGVLTALRRRGGQVDQIGMAQLLGLDRSTTGLVVGLLERRNLLRRDPHPTDRRRLVLSLTPDGERLLAAVVPAVERARRRLLEPFSDEEAAAFHALLDRLLEHHNAVVRVPLLSSGEPNRAYSTDA